MSDGEETPVIEEAEVVATEAPAPGAPLDLNSAIRAVLKKALAHDGLARGLSEATRAIEKGQAQLVLLADNCDQPDYKKLIEALAAEQGVSLLSVEDNTQLGEWAGLCRLDEEGNARKVRPCSCAVVTDYGEESEAYNFLQEHLKNA